jgi:hypothetical protein
MASSRQRHRTKSKPDTDTTGEYQAVVSGTLLRNVWLDRNLGATQKATSGTDSNAYGTYYKLMAG